MMKNRSNLLWIVLPIVGVAAFVVWLFLPYETHWDISLAEPRASASAPPYSGSPLNYEVELNPDNVQAVIRTLARPESYSRDYSVSLFWQSGSSASVITLTVDDKTLTVNGETYPREGMQLSRQDALAHIPTYEDILELPRSDILSASYREYENSPYIVVRFNGLLYTHEYYISTDSGLLDYAQKYDGETLVYSMDAI
jgi:hypothetical protein